MALVLTRRAGEAIIFRRMEDGVLREARLYIISITDGVVRLSIQAPADVVIAREELLRAG